MKSPPFDYCKPASLDEVFSLLAQHGDDARILAGGQTLMATLNMRLSEPALLIDITGLEALRGIRVQADRLYIGALALSVRMPHVVATELRASEWRLSSPFVVATIAGALAWFGMSAGMLHGPLTLAVCAATSVFIGGAMGWHLLSMYAPAALAARWPVLFPATPTLVVALGAMLAGGVAVRAGASVAGVTLGLVAIGAGWGAVNVAAMRLLHDGARPSRAALALHDACLLGAAAAGALLF